jgi:hypothetical protein
MQAQVNRSTKRSDNVMEYSETLLARMKELEATVKQQQSQIVDLEELKGGCPIQVFGKVRKGQRGTTSWPLFVWE